MGWFDLLDVKGTLKSLLQHHNSKAYILRCSAFFMVQLCAPAGILRWFWFVHIFLTSVILIIVILVDVKLRVLSNLNFYFANDEYLMLSIFFLLINHSYLFGGLFSLILPIEKQLSVHSLSRV